MSDDHDHPLTYLAACDLLGPQPKFGRRFARKLEHKARPIRSTPKLYGRVDPIAYRQTARIDACGRIGTRVDT